MVAVGLDRAMTLFMDPECPRVRVRSRSFIEHDMKDGENDLNFFGKQPRKTGTSGYNVRKDDVQEDCILVMDKLAELMKEVNPKRDTYTVAHAVNAPMPTIFHVDKGTGEVMQGISRA